jgi:hypothetical protein
MRGVRVLELSCSIAGAYCTRVLAAVGADVVILGAGRRGRRSAIRAPWIPGSDRPPGRCARPQRPISTWTTEALGRGGRRGSRPADPLGGHHRVQLRWRAGTRLALHDRIAALNPAAVRGREVAFGLTGPYANWKHSP